MPHWEMTREDEINYIFKSANSIDRPRHGNQAKVFRNCRGSWLFGEKWFLMKTVDNHDVLGKYFIEWIWSLKNGNPLYFDWWEKTRIQVTINPRHIKRKASLRCLQHYRGLELAKQFSILCCRWSLEKTLVWRLRLSKTSIAVNRILGMSPLGKRELCWKWSSFNVNRS